LASDNRSLCFTHRNHHYSLLTLKNKECYFWVQIVKFA
jgi:hypothetical protein